MSWIDDLARWAAGPDDGGPIELPRLSRRGALAVFGATAAAVATGTLGDPPEAEAIGPRCCDPDNVGTWSCPEGTTCCCYTVPGGGGHNECCSDGKTCQAQPGQLDHGVQVVACCHQVCAHECCGTPEEVCNSQGYCFACGDLEMCGDDCCEFDHECVAGKCTIKCPTGQTGCVDTCCTEGEECVGGACMTKCAPGAPRCGVDSLCCDPGQSCENNVCVDCPAPKTQCGDACCGPSETCCDASRSLCCTSPKGCREEYSTCVCPDNTCMCGGDCCGPGEFCAGESCQACPPGTEECGGFCCPAGSTCKFPDYSGSTGCKGHCECDSGGLLCGDKCCAKNDICLDGVCIPCAPTSDACIDYCCQAPFVCSIDQCVCPDAHTACADGCCGPDDECVNGRCLPACDYDVSSGRCGEVCCPADELCIGGTCQKCPADTTTCGAICCPTGEFCFAAGDCRKPATAPAHAKTPKTVTVEHGTATVTVTCTGGCAGTVALQTVAAHTSVLALLSARKRRLVLGKAKFKVPAGRKSAKVHVHLSSSGKRYLAKHHGKLKAQALVKTSGTKTTYLSRAFTLKSRRPKR